MRLTVITLLGLAAVTLPVRAADMARPHDASIANPSARAATRQVVVAQRWPAPIVAHYAMAGRPTAITYVTRPVVVLSIEGRTAEVPIRTRY
jgi:hypothetical protein